MSKTNGMQWLKRRTKKIQLEGYVCSCCEKLRPAGGCDVRAEVKTPVVICGECAKLEAQIATLIDYSSRVGNLIGSDESRDNTGQPSRKALLVAATLNEAMDRVARSFADLENKRVNFGPTAAVVLALLRGPFTIQTMQLVRLTLRCAQGQFPFFDAAATKRAVTIERNRKATA